MKRIYNNIPACIIMSFLSATATAQMENTTAENFETETQLVFQNCEEQSANVQSGGKNITWDYSGLKIKTNDTTVEVMIDPKETPYGNQYPEADLTEQYSDGKYVFLHKTVDKSYLVGYVDPSNKMLATYKKPVLIAKRPMKLGEKVTDSFTTAYSIQKMDFKGTGDVNIEADGYGTLLLPNGKFTDVIRLKITQTQHDTLIQYSSPSMTQITTYVWFDNKHASALLKISEIQSGNFTSKSVQYLLTETKRK